MIEVTTLSDTALSSLPEGKKFSIGKAFYLHYWKDLFWFRFFGGYGLHVRKPSWKGRLLFSERNGKTRVYQIFGYRIKILKPYR